MLKENTIPYKIFCLKYLIKFMARVIEMVNMNIDYKAIGQRIRAKRKAKNLTQEKLAELTGYSTNHISKLESSRTKLSFDLLVAIAIALQIEMKELFNFDEYKDKNFLVNELLSYINRASCQQVELLYKIYNSLNN